MSFITTNLNVRTVNMGLSSLDGAGLCCLEVRWLRLMSSVFPPQSSRMCK